MKYLILIVALIALIVIFSFIPFKMNIYNKGEYLCFDFASFLTIKLNLYLLLDPSNKDELKKQIEATKILKQVKVKLIRFNLSGFNFDYKLNPAYYGIFYSVLGIASAYAKVNNLDFKYRLNYYGKKKLDFESVIKLNLVKVIKGLVL